MLYRRWLFALLASGFMLAVMGCEMTTYPSGPAVSVPSHFASVESPSASAATGWLKDLSDSRLTAIVDDAMQYNYDLAASAARLKAAGASLQIVNSARLPRLGLDGGAARRQSVVETNDGQGRSRPRDIYGNNYDIGASLNWELDLWGKLLNRKQAAVADLQAATAEHYGFILSLAANVARSWFSAVESQLQWQLAHDTVDSLEKNLNFVERGVDLGTSEVLDLRLTRANVLNARSNLEAQTRRRDEAARALEVLLGRYPKNAITIADALPDLRRPVAPGLPSELLRRRPDLRASERRLQATAERVMASKKEFLPSFRLTGSTGIGSDQLRRLLNAEYLAWSIVGGATQPVFEGGRLTGELKRANAQYEEQLATFNQKVIQAFREVETALAAEAFLERQAQAEEMAAEESIAAENLAWDQYTRGLIESLTWLEAQRRSFNSRSSLLQLQNLRLQNRIDLYLALGGDFR